MALVKVVGTLGEEAVRKASVAIKHRCGQPSFLHAWEPRCNSPQRRETCCSPYASPSSDGHTARHHFYFSLHSPVSALFAMTEGSDRKETTHHIFMQLLGLRGAGRITW